MGLGPVDASAQRCWHAGLTLGDIDLAELNEAFAVQALAVLRELGLSEAITNVNGGAIALGHPLGCSGAAHPDHADPRDAARRGRRVHALWAGDALRGRRPGRGDDYRVGK